MILRELLAELRNNVLRDRSDAVDTPSDGFLWDDASLVRYIDDAQNKFARLTRCLRDGATPAVCEVALAAGVGEYSLDARVVEVLTARLGAVGLRRASAGPLAGSPGDIALGALQHDASAAGTPVWFTTDEQVRTLRVYPTPNEDATLALRVVRLPLIPLSTANLGASPEIPADYHLDLLEWAAWRAYRNHDVDGENMAKANSHKKRFLDAVEEVRQASKRLMLETPQFDIRARY